MPTPENLQGQQPDQLLQRRNYHEEKDPDGQVRERSWETLQGKKISEIVKSRRYWKRNPETNKRELVSDDLITKAHRYEQTPDRQGRFVQIVTFIGQAPKGISSQREYQSPNPYLILEGYAEDANNFLTDSRGRGYYRILYPDGEVARFWGEQGRAFNREDRYEETPDGWKKTSTLWEVNPRYDGIHGSRIKVLSQHEELVQKDQLPSLPDPDTPNGLPSLDAIPAEYYKDSRAIASRSRQPQPESPQPTAPQAPQSEKPLSPTARRAMNLRFD